VQDCDYVYGYYTCLHRIHICMLKNKNLVLQSCVVAMR
jgi:hypothetical protein